MILLLLVLSISEGMNVSLDDPVLGLDIQSLSGEILTLDQVAEDTLCFILSVRCSHCSDAIRNARVHFDGAHQVFLFLGTEKEVEAYLAGFPWIDRGAVFLVADPAQLKKHEIDTLPTLLGYRDSALKIAAHGVLDDRACSILLESYQRRANAASR